MARSDWRRPETFDCPNGRRRVAMELSYDGRAFSGWQSQNNAPSVQETLRRAVMELLEQENVEIVGSGRTDAGVHAYGQVAHAEFDDCRIPEKAFLYGINAKLPYSVRIRRAWDCGPSFHARYSAMAREYRYFIRQGLGHDSFNDGLVTLVPEIPDVDLMNCYAKLIEGTHDFTTFASARDICPSKFRDIYECGFSWQKDMYGHDVLCFRICGNAFLYHMVRSIVGSCLEFAQKGVKAERFSEILDARDRSLAGKTAPSDGLYLWRVSYDENEYLWFENGEAEHE